MKIVANFLSQMTAPRIDHDAQIPLLQQMHQLRILPWIRTFMGRILAVESDCPKLKQLFQRDFSAMYRMYFGEYPGAGAKE